MTFRPITFIDTWALCSALHKERSRFKSETRRQDMDGSPHRETQAIFLRGPANPDETNWYEDVEQVDYQILKDWKTARNVLSRIQSAIGGRPLGKAMIVQLQSGGKVAWHVDEGPYYERHHRLHLPLITNPMSLMFSGAASMHMPVGMLCGINNRVLHSAINAGQTPRVHLIVDVVINLEQKSDDD